MYSSNKQTRQKTRHGAHVFRAELLVGDKQLGPFPHLVAGQARHSEVQEQTRCHWQRDLKRKGQTTATEGKWVVREALHAWLARGIIKIYCNIEFEKETAMKGRVLGARFALSYKDHQCRRT